MIAVLGLGGGGGPFRASGMGKLIRGIGLGVSVFQGLYAGVGGAFGLPGDVGCWARIRWV